MSILAISLSLSLSLGIRTHKFNIKLLLVVAVKAAGNNNYNNNIHMQMLHTHARKMHRTTIQKKNQFNLNEILFSPARVLYTDLSWASTQVRALMLCCCQGPSRATTVHKMNDLETCSTDKSRLKVIPKWFVYLAGLTNCYFIFIVCDFIVVSFFIFVRFVLCVFPFWNTFNSMWIFDILWQRLSDEVFSLPKKNTVETRNCCHLLVSCNCIQVELGRPLCECVCLCTIKK